MLLCFKLQEHVNKHAPKWTVHFPKLLLALSVSVMDDIYKKIAIRLNDWGKIRSNPDYLKSLFQTFNDFKILNWNLHCYYRVIFSNLFSHFQ